MTITPSDVINKLSPSLPNDITNRLLTEFLGIKQNLVLGRYSPSELNGGRFAECVVRLIQHLDNPPYIPFGTQIKDIDQAFRRVENNSSLHESLRFYIPRLSRILLDVRNRRNVAHVGGDVDPNYSDSLLISQITDWILSEIIRIFYHCSIEEAKKIVEGINQVHIPIIFNHNGFLKVLNSDLSNREKTLVLLYNKKPDNVSDSDLVKWLKYSNPSQFKKTILAALDKDALIHYHNNCSVLTPKGVAFVEKHLNKELSV